MVCAGRLQLPYLQLNGLLHMFTRAKYVCSSHIYIACLHTHTNSIPSGYLSKIIALVLANRTMHTNLTISQTRFIDALRRYERYLPRKAARVCYKIAFILYLDMKYFEDY